MLFVLSILLSLAIVRIAAALDRTAVRAALQDAAAVFAAARNGAFYRRTPVAVVIDAARGTVEAHVDTLRLVRRDLHAAFGVAVAATRDTMAYDARGLGVGAANLSLVVQRGRAVDTLFLSRLGRVRY